jgi:DNA invertase Pin-like site-specific DNA recombinase
MSAWARSGLEVSRLARSSSDWHQLLEICALTGTLILDEDGLYDLATFNDRLLLGLKGTMSEAELYVLRARLQGGILNKARRAALKLPMPTTQSSRTMMCSGSQSPWSRRGAVAQCCWCDSSR